MPSKQSLKFRAKRFKSIIMVSIRSYRFLWIVVCAALFFHPSARAKDKEVSEALPKGDFSELRLTGTKRVSAVIDPQTVQLEGGELFRLPGIDLPDFRPHAPGPISQVSMDVLKDLLTGKLVNIYQGNKKDSALKNRLGHHLAQLELKEGGTWVQGALISLGLARARTVRSNPEMAAQMYELEEQARSQKLGLWALEDYQILDPSNVLPHEGSFQIVEGRVVSASMKQNRIYLNFGKNWRDDFTVTIAPKDRKVFTKSRLDPLQLNGKTIRVRGWVEEYNGPFIEIDHPQRIEILSEEG